MPSFRPLSPDEARTYAATLTDRCWPGGGDRAEPVAAEWLRRWGPRGAQPLPPACSCRAGRCEVCN